VYSQIAIVGQRLSDDRFAPKSGPMADVSVICRSGLEEKEKKKKDRGVTGGAVLRHW
jgi:hypothetical protein